MTEAESVERADDAHHHYCPTCGDLCTAARAEDCLCSCTPVHDVPPAAPVLPTCGDDCMPARGLHIACPRFAEPAPSESGEVTAEHADDKPLSAVSCGVRLVLEANREIATLRSRITVLERESHERSGKLETLRTDLSDVEANARIYAAERDTATARAAVLEGLLRDIIDGAEHGRPTAALDAARAHLATLKPPTDAKP